MPPDIRRHRNYGHIEYGLPYSWRQEFAIHGFDLVDKGLKKFVEFCTRIDTWDKRTTKKGDATSEDKNVTFFRQNLGQEMRESYSYNSETVLFLGKRDQKVT